MGDDRVSNFYVSPHFDRTSLLNFNAAIESKKLDDFLNSLPKADSTDSTSANPRATHGWKEDSVEIHLPDTGVRLESESDTLPYRVSGLQRISVAEVTKSVLKSQDDN